jgi:hypothetical protein
MTREQLIEMAKGVREMDDPEGEGFGESVDDVIGAAEAGQDIAAAVLDYLTTANQVWIVRKAESEDVMVFSNEIEAGKYVEWLNRDIEPTADGWRPFAAYMLDAEPVFASSADCRHWCHGDDSEEVAS